MSSFAKRCTSISVSFSVLTVAGLFIHSTLMRRSLWEDEAWVANSVLSPSVETMFHYPRWLQTSPPLFLLLVRFSTRYLGQSEIAFRLIPWLAGVLSIVLVIMVLWRLFSPPLAILGGCFLTTNYWVAKYSQQVKQFTCELLVSSLFLYLLLRYLKNGRPRGIFWALVLTGGAGIFLSYSTIFWFPAVLPALLTNSRNKGEHERNDERLQTRPLARKFAPALTALMVYAGCLATVYLFFIRSNRTAELTDFWRRDFIGSGGWLSSLRRFLETGGDLMIPQQFGWSRAFSYAAGILIAVAVLRLIVEYSKKGISQNIFWVSILVPVVASIPTSARRLYPLLTYPRMILWMLPILTVLLVYAIEPFWTWLTKKISMSDSALEASVALFTTLICAGAILADIRIVNREAEGHDSRGAVAYLKQHMSPQDQLFVRGIIAEELIYYGHRLAWYPGLTFVGNSNLSCCLRRSEVIPPPLALAGFQADLWRFASSVGGKEAWFMMSSSDFHHVSPVIAGSMSSQGCRDVSTRMFEQLVLLQFDCTLKHAPKL
jgi:hypothetical protein